VRRKRARAFLSLKRGGLRKVLERVASHSLTARPQPPNRPERREVQAQRLRDTIVLPGELAKPLRRACVRPARGRRLSAHDRQRRPLMVSENHSEAV
jgi:hypothetical protein